MEQQAEPQPKSQDQDQAVNANPTDQEEQKQSKKSQNKQARDAKKQERLAKRQDQAKHAEEEYKIDPNDPMIGKFGDQELNRSQSDPEQRYAKVYTPIKELSEDKEGQEVWIRGRLHSSKPKGKLCFFVIREQFSTVQAGLFIESSSKGMIEFARRIPKESIIEVKAKVVVPRQEVDGQQ